MPSRQASTVIGYSIPTILGKATGLPLPPKPRMLGIAICIESLNREEEVHDTVSWTEKVSSEQLLLFNEPDKIPL